MNYDRSRSHRPSFCSDREGLAYFKRYLLNHNFTNVNITSNTYEAWDIDGTYNGQTYYFELKKRDIDSFQWGDSICEQHKIDAVPDKNRAYLVNLFTDCITIIPLTADHEVQHKLCQKTHNWDRTKVMKNLLSYKNEDKYRHEYE